MNIIVAVIGGSGAAVGPSEESSGLAALERNSESMWRNFGYVPHSVVLFINLSYLQDI